MSHALRWNPQSHTATTMATQATRPMTLPAFRIPMPRSLHVGSSCCARREPFHAASVGAKDALSRPPLRQSSGWSVGWSYAWSVDQVVLEGDGHGLGAAAGAKLGIAKDLVVSQSTAKFQGAFDGALLLEARQGDRADAGKAVHSTWSRARTSGASWRLPPSTASSGYAPMVASSGALERTLGWTPVLTGRAAGGRRRPLRCRRSAGETRGGRRASPVPCEASCRVHRRRSPGRP